MVQNVGILDRAGRALLSCIMLAYAWKKPGKFAVLASCGAGMLVSSVASGYCPLYKLAGINTVGKPI